jgi:hypothetical protein
VPPGHTVMDNRKHLARPYLVVKEQRRWLG